MILFCLFDVGAAAITSLPSLLRASLVYVWSLLVAFVLWFVYGAGAGATATATATANMVFSGLLCLMHALSLVSLVLWFTYGAGVATTVAVMVFPCLLCLVHARSLVYIR
ncbi:Aldolase_II domain-containing protein [Mucor velutinosus]|uniref:Aldolase_II domain-containing protein n=1 Tax=Mucor velutinosus TaxID=708070 RepID=A0AAN7DH41_9FUNG|nr:Aldolase_II domain-containing protein [Mucor velutinosus]